jgi:hypothetical protein
LLRRQRHELLVGPHLLRVGGTAAVREQIQVAARVKISGLQSRQHLVVEEHVPFSRQRVFRQRFRLHEHVDDVANDIFEMWHIAWPAAVA